MAEVTCVLAAGVIALGCAAMWARGWPNHAQSRWFAVLSRVGIAVAALGQSCAAAAFVACTAFATIAAYIASFHTPRLMMINFAVAATVASIDVIRSTGEANLFHPPTSFSAGGMKNVSTRNRAVSPPERRQM